MADITYSDLTQNEKRIFLSVRSKGYNVSPNAIRTNAFEENWIQEGVGGFVTSFDITLINGPSFVQGDEISFTVQGDNVVPATDLYWTLSGTDGDIDNTDFTSTSGIVSLPENVDTQTQVLSVFSLSSALVGTDADFIISIKTDGYDGTVQATEAFTLTEA